MTATIRVEAEPYEFTFTPATCALLIIDMQRDFLEPGGFGEMLGNDVSQLRRTIEPNVKLLARWRAAGLQVIHTREGRRDDLLDLPPTKKSAAGARPPSVIPDRWAGFWCGASPGTTSFPSFIRNLAKR